jgi:aromatic ring-opening dioxygenase catalytic subunit (LigB family)
MSIVAALAAGHAPGITGWPESAPPDQTERFFQGYEKLRKTLIAARPEMLVVVTPEHWANFFLDKMPAFCLGIGQEFAGPLEDPKFLRVPRTKVPGAPTSARKLFEAMSGEIDLAFSEELILDHGTMVPLHLLTPQMNLPVIPLIVNCLAHPMPPLERCYRMGRVLGEAVRSWPERVALLATGGLSHWPAMLEAGTINVEFDQGFLRLFKEGRAREFMRNTDAEVESQAGPGAHEIRCWMALAGALEGAKGEIFAYEPVKPWATGCAVASLELPKG